MDKARADRITRELLNSKVGRWNVVGYVSHGKSAIVLKAEKSPGDNIAALKLFDPELIERYGHDVQEERIRRELLLRGKHHENLITILDGGRCDRTGYYFVVMQYIDAPSLANVLEAVPPEKIWPIVSQVASAARFLESLEIAHRDIKPDNIAVTSDFTKAVLLDLGVIHPFGIESITDEDQKVFLGTLRYSSPEFLFRNEKDTLDGWRALTFYQLGAVLHDMIMRKRLFEELSDPYARLVEAVKYEIPHIESHDISPSLVLLAKNCLTKDPNLRLRLVRWEDFEPRLTGHVSVSEAKERIIKRRVYYKEQTKERIDIDKEREMRAIRKTVDELKMKIRAIIHRECTGSDLFPPIEINEMYSAEPAETYILVYFSCSEEHALKESLSICFILKLLDRYSRASEIAYIAGLWHNKVDVATFKHRTPHTIFEGVFEEAIVKNKVLDILYLLFDKSQQCNQSTDEKQIPLEPLWLDAEMPKD